MAFSRDNDLYVKRHYRRENCFLLHEKQDNEFLVMCFKHTAYVRAFEKSLTLDELLSFSPLSLAKAEVKNEQLFCHSHRAPCKR